MNATERRKQILNTLQLTNVPVSATALAQQLGVSRQIIVGDVALLRAAGSEICATPRGYVILRSPAGYTRRIACCHDSQGMGTELHAIIDLGCTIADVIVEHPIYGQITGPLQLSTHADVDQFIARCTNVGAHPLSQLTEGIHLHTIACPDEAHFEQVQKKLSELGILLAD